MNLSPEIRRAVKRYGESQPDSYAGAWVATRNGEPRLFVAFTSDLEVHAQLLPDEVEVVLRPRSIKQLEALAEEVRADAVAIGIEITGIRINHDRSVLEVMCVAGDPDQARAIVHNRWSDRVELDLVPPTTVRRPRLDHWISNEPEQSITVVWVGAPTETAEIWVEEFPDRVEVTIEATLVETGRVSLTAAEHSQLVQLRQALGGREVREARH